jgi:hypothetical protein
MGWNGLDLVSDFSAELGDTTPNFKTKVLRWINEGLREISTNHQWPCLREKGQVVLAANTDTHALPLAQPGAPVASLAAGGSLTADTQYRALVTFYEEFSGVESVAGESVSITPTGSDLSFELSDIPVSTSPLVTARKVYISKGAAAFVYHGIIDNNLTEIPDPDPLLPGTPVTYTVSADASSPVQPPEEDAIFQIDGDLFIEGRRIISGTSNQNLLFLSNGVESTGEPYHFAPINQTEVKVYPAPSSDTTVSFFYFKLPARVYGLSTSVPQMPSWIYETLRAYVIWRGYEYRDRAGKESKELNYSNSLTRLISRKGKPIKKSGRVRVTTPDSDGYGF